MSSNKEESAEASWLSAFSEPILFDGVYSRNSPLNAAHDAFFFSIPIDYM